MITGNSGATDANSLLADWVLGLFEISEVGILVDTAMAGVTRLSEHPIPLRRYRRRQGVNGLLGRE